MGNDACRKFQGAESMTATIQGLLKNFGLLFVTAGIVLAGMEYFYSATATPATAQIVEIGRSCEKHTCVSGNCRWRRFKCAHEAALIAEVTKVRRKKHAKLSFGNGSEPLTAWASFSKLELRSNAAVGDKLPILYRGPAPYYVTLPLSVSHIETGIKSLLLGLVLLYAARRFAKTAQQGQSGQSSQLGKSGRNPQPHKKGTTASGTSVNPSAATVAKRPPIIPNPFASRPDRAPGYISKPRQNVVQRNKSWF